MGTTLTTAESFNQFYAKRKTDNKYGWQADWRYRVRESLFEQLMSKPYFPQEGDLLELGCGNGVMGLWFAPCGFSIYGFDISPTAVEWANENALKANASAEFREGNILYPDEPFKGRSFDFIFDGDSTQYLGDNDWAVFYKRIFSILNPGGLFWLTVDLLNENFQGEYHDKHWHYNAGDRTASFGNKQYRIGASREHIIEEFTAAGFMAREMVDFSLYDFEECPPSEKASLLPFHSLRSIALSLCKQ